MKKSFKEIALGMALYYCTTIAPNFLAHSLSAIYDSFEAINHPTFIVEDGLLRVSKEHKLLMEHQRKSIEELTSPWLFVPGSFLWRWVERPNLENQKRNETYRNKNEKRNETYRNKNEKINII